MAKRVPRCSFLPEIQRPHVIISSEIRDFCHTVTLVERLASILPSLTGTEGSAVAGIISASSKNLQKKTFLTCQFLLASIALFHVGSSRIVGSNFRAKTRALLLLRFGEQPIQSRMESVAARAHTEDRQGIAKVFGQPTSFEEIQR